MTSFHENIWFLSSSGCLLFVIIKLLINFVWTCLEAQCWLCFPRKKEYLTRDLLNVSCTSPGHLWDTVSIKSKWVQSLFLMYLSLKFYLVSFQISEKISTSSNIFIRVSQLLCLFVTTSREIRELSPWTKSRLIPRSVHAQTGQGTALNKHSF